MKIESEEELDETSSREKDVRRAEEEVVQLSVVNPPADGPATSLSLAARLYLRKLIGVSPIFIAAKTQVMKLAQYEVSVLILGQTGTGKELFARAVHYLSARSERPFIPVNCGAIPLDLVENELFGHEVGAYTGANSTRMGLIQEANGGTLFLDEIDALPLLAQVKLLRFLQDQEYRPVGSSRVCHANLRIIAATNASITRAVAEGKFRQDLFYRLNTVPLVVPPLCERVEDILLLADYFLKRYTREFEKRIEGFSASAQDMILHYNWPGNVRELEHIVARAVILSHTSTIQSEDLCLPEAPTQPMACSFSEAKAAAITRFERAYLQSLMTSHQGNISKAACAAQKDRRVLRDLLRKHHIEASRFKTNPSF